MRKKDDRMMATFQMKGMYDWDGTCFITRKDWQSPPKMSHAEVSMKWEGS
jgi:hypothetical protein